MPALDSLTALSALNIQNNKFTFEDIEPNLGVPSGSFIYSPQDSVGSRSDTTLQPGASLILSVFVAGSDNNYQWLRNNSEIPDAINSSYEITSASAADTGPYVCLITSMLATELTLSSRAAYVGVEGITGVDLFSVHTPMRQVLQQNYPNPFNPVTTIQYDLPVTDYVVLKIFDLSGREVQTLVNGIRQAGPHQVIFNSTGLASGVYFYQLQTSAGFMQTRKLILLR